MNGGVSKRHLEKWDRLNSGITPRIRGVPEFGMGARIHDLPNSGTPPQIRRVAPNSGGAGEFGARPEFGGVGLWICERSIFIKNTVWWGEGLHPKGIDASETDGDVKTEARKCYDCEK